MAAASITEVFFLIDGVRLELQACLLAPTLHRHLTRNQRPAAYIREDYSDNLAPITREILSAAGVDLRILPDTDGTHRPWTAPYPQGNKILAAAQSRKCDVSVFLDTDTVLVRPVDFAKELGRAEIAASVSDFAASASTEAHWIEYYGLFGMPLPEDRVTLRAGRRLTHLPYFNAGMVIFRERTSKTKPTGIGAEWLAMAAEFDARATMDYDRANIDQLTLPILGYKRGKPVKQLDKHLNFNIEAHGLGEGEAQSIAHYHRVGILWAHAPHSHQTLDCLTTLVGQDGLDRVMQTFLDHIKRKRLKQYLTL